MEAVLFDLKSRVAKRSVLTSMHNAENADSFTAAGALQSCVWIGTLLTDRTGAAYLWEIQFLCKWFSWDPQLEFIAPISVALEMASLLERQLRPAGEACLPLVSSFKCWQVEMEVGAGVINKRLCFPHLWKEKDLCVTISWSPKISLYLLIPEHFKHLLEIRIWVFGA